MCGDSTSEWPAAKGSCARLMFLAAARSGPRRGPATAPLPALPCRLLLRVLDGIARDTGDAPLALADRFGLALTHGLSHSATHSLFFFVSWLPLCLGDGTIYNDHCPAMSYYLVGALTTLAFAALLTGSMVLAIEGLERHALRPALTTSGLHLAAALLTLANFAHHGCLVTVPLLLTLGAGTAAWAARLWWQQTLRVPRLLPAPEAAAERIP